MKKIIIVFLSLFIIFSVSSCDNKKDSSINDNNNVKKEKTEKTATNQERKMTDEEILEFNKMFVFEIEDKNSTDNEVNVNPICYFFTSYYEDVRDMDMGKFVKYIPRETFLNNEDAREIEDLKAKGFEIPFSEIENAPVPFGRIPYSKVEKILNDYANVELKDMKNMSDAIYSKENQCFYSYASDFDVFPFNAESGTIKGDIVTLKSDVSKLTLKKEERNYYIQSHTPLK